MTEYVTRCPECGHTGRIVFAPDSDVPELRRICFYDAAIYCAREREPGKDVCATCGIEAMYQAKERANG